MIQIKDMQNAGHFGMHAGRHHRRLVLTPVFVPAMCSNWFEIGA